MTQRLRTAELLAHPERWQRFVADLKAGAVAVIPTDTLYGFAVDGDSPDGVAAIYRLKGRGGDKPLILFLPDLSRLGELGIRPEPRCLALLRGHWPGGLTAVFPFPRTGGPLTSTLSPQQRGEGARPPHGEAEKRVLSAFPHPTLGVRVPDHADLRQLLSDYPGYLLTTSVNRSGCPPVADPDEIEREFGGETAWLLDGGPLPPSEPSTVADFGVWPPRILRQGKIRLDALPPEPAPV